MMVACGTVAIASLAAIWARATAHLRHRPKKKNRWVTARAKTNRQPQRNLLRDLAPPLGLGT